MATALNAYNCLTGNSNTGVAQCALDIKNFVGAILLPPGTVIPQASLTDPATFLTYLQTQTYAARSNRFFPIHDFQEFTDSSETNTYQTLGYGARAKTKNGYFGLTYQFVRGGMCLYLQLFKMASPNWDALFIDASGVVVGQKVGNGLRGIPQALFDTPALKFNDGSKITAYTVYFSFAQDFLTSFGFMQLNPGDFDSVLGLQSVVLSEAVARAGAVLNIAGVFSCGASISIYDAYGASLAQVTAWVATDAVTGASLTITSVTQNASQKAYTITLATTGNYVAGNKVIISLAAPSVLNTAPINVSGIESLTVTTAS